MHTNEIEYQHGDITLRGYLAADSKEKKPCVMVAHPWVGRGAFVMEKAEHLAELGFAGFAIDMYGNAELGADKDECASLMNPFLADRNLRLTRQRLPPWDSASAECAFWISPEAALISTG
jgi:dienelactone hydrolase